MIATLVPALVAALAATAPVERVLVLAARNDGGPERETLRWAHKDAETVAAVFGELGGIAASERMLLIEPDRAAIEATLAIAQARLASAPPGARTELLFYYSGHADEVGLLLGRERYPFRELRTRLDAIAVDLRIVVVDACASGALLGQRPKGGVRTAPFLGDGDLTGHAYFTSAAADEIAQESDHLEASFFTHDLVTGLRGAADRDRDRTVTLTEAYRYAFDATLARTEKSRSPQHPAWDIALVGAGDVVLTRLDVPSARLVFGAAMRGRYFVRGGRGALGGESLVAELEKAAGETLELALPEGTWTIATHRSGRRLEAIATLAGVLPLALKDSDFKDVGPALEGRPRGDPPIRLRLSFIPLLGFEGLGDDVVVHGAAFAFLGDRILSIRGAQLATLFNVADEVTGVQISLVNVGGRVRGTQIGVVNVADDLEGASIGLFSWVGGPDGLRHLEVYGGTELPLSVGWRVGARWLHTAVALGTDFADCELSIATGTEIDLSPVTLGFDFGPRLSAKKCAPERLGGDVSLALRTILGVRILPAVHLFVGASGAVELESGDLTPGFFGGLRFFR